MYYRNAHAALVVYSVGNKDSFDRAVKWIEELRRQSDNHTIIILAGNKSDIPDHTKQVSLEDAQSVADKMDVEYHTTCSAKSGAGIEELFEEIGKRLPIEQAKQKMSRGGANEGIKLDKVSEVNDGQTESCAC